MIDYEGMRLTIVKGLREYLNVPVIRSNQNAEMPPYPYISYTVTTLMSSNNGTYGEYEDGIDRKPVISTWSFTALSGDNSESVMLAMKSREWFERVGSVYLNDNKVVVQSVSSITNRDNVISIGYEYRNGFDCFFWCFDEIEMPDQEVVEKMAVGDDWNERLKARLEGVKRFALTSNPEQGEEDEALNELENRLDGVE